MHPDLACLDLAERRKAFPRALRVSGPLGSVQVRLYLERIRPAVVGSRKRDPSAAGAPDGAKVG
ncbi:hypothetical protein FRAAL5761 [Frankia alni ACN14a]|uniref:YlxR domain-containing protein n=1 Tax=Frankia alni (strain DSM 45986 / CECT 9034 / ACN14a) TaxID=326424 RepID=Q0RDS3_FRAAA|nr:hypothetical protein FRAAL5761 [Frankia alni ACN14a]